MPFDEMEHLIDNWINGNKKFVKDKMKRKSKLFALQMVERIKFSHFQDFQTALNEVKKMCGWLDD